LLRLEIKHLRLISTIAELGNLTRAAEALCLSQPALSKQLAELEEKLEFALFYRTKKAMVLTEPGIEFHERARKILGDVVELETQLHQYANGASGKLKISIDRVHRDDWLPAVMKRFRGCYPHIGLEIKQVPELLRSLQNKEVDIVIVGEAIAAAGIDYVPLNQDEMVAVLPLNHPLCQKTYISAHDLAGVDLVYYFELKQSYLYRRYLYPNQISLGSFHHIQNIDAIIELIKAGEGVSVLPKRMVADAAARQLINVRPIGEDGFSFTWYAGLSRDSDKPYLAGFIDLLKSEILGGQGSADT
jgi:DNA-binding transcriptional LysR family regulator